MSLTSSIKLNVSAVQSSALDLGTRSFPAALNLAIALANGTGANQADLMFSDTRTLTASATEDLDLAASLTDSFGATITFARIKAIIISAASGNANNVNVTRPASNGVPLFLAASDGLAVRPGGLFALVGPDATGVAVTAGTGDLLTFTNSAGSTSVSYSIIILGASA